ncbi:MAG: hypothetical protein OXB84_07435, partial [Halobacteriovoraceae bacterium]|nr:hypothetical protein [Halobacteriovoraceae bacterium]
MIMFFFGLILFNFSIIESLDANMDLNKAYKREYVSLKSQKKILLSQIKSLKRYSRRTEKRIDLELVEMQKIVNGLTN